jgi:t-SNARE complex subunit (syntaxin)
MFVAVLYKEDDGTVISQKVMNAHSHEEAVRLAREAWNEKNELTGGEEILAMSED